MVVIDHAPDTDTDNTACATNTVRTVGVGNNDGQGGVMDKLTGMVFHSAEREVERLEQRLEEARQATNDLRRQCAEERMRANAAEFAVAQLRDEAADLRRQLAEAQAGLAAARIAMQAYAALAAICPTCGGSGEVDSGGVTPWGVGIDVTCPTCNGSGKVYNDTDRDTTPHRVERERLAETQHDIWSHWMTYQFSVCERNDDGTMTIPAEKVLRWERQAGTLYGYLPEAERESDRRQADKILAAFTPAKGASGTIRLTLQQLEEGQAARDDSPATGEGER